MFDHKNLRKYKLNNRNGLTIYYFPFNGKINCIEKYVDNKEVEPNFFDKLIIKYFINYKFKK